MYQKTCQDGNMASSCSEEKSNENSKQATDHKSTNKTSLNLKENSNTNINKSADNKNNPVLSRPTIRETKTTVFSFLCIKVYQKEYETVEPEEADDKSENSYNI